MTQYYRVIIRDADGSFHDVVYFEDLTEITQSYLSAERLFKAILDNSKKNHEYDGKQLLIEDPFSHVTFKKVTL